MSTLIIGATCRDGVVLAADRRELRGLEPTERTKINKIGIKVGRKKAAVLLAGAGIAAFWDEVTWSVMRLIESLDGAKAETLLDVIDNISCYSSYLSARYQRDGLDERLGCVVAGLEGITSGKPQLYHFAGAGFSRTDFVCLGSGDRYALPMADILLNQKELTTEQAVRFMPLLFLLVERVNLAVGEGPDIFVLGVGKQPIAVPAGLVRKAKTRAASIVEVFPSVFPGIAEDPAILREMLTKKEE